MDKQEERSANEKDFELKFLGAKAERKCCGIGVLENEIVEDIPDCAPEGTISDTF